VLTIALDLGYASLGPFNRAFKEMTGITPTAYRQQELGRTSADTE
jgi:AraC-like DNA-binding protein